jgi:hypothetical protein
MVGVDARTVAESRPSSHSTHIKINASFTRCATYGFNFWQFLACLALLTCTRGRPASTLALS